MPNQCAHCLLGIFRHLPPENDNKIPLLEQYFFFSNINRGIDYSTAGKFPELFDRLRISRL